MPGVASSNGLVWPTMMVGSRAAEFVLARRARELAEFVARQQPKQPSQQPKQPTAARHDEL